LASKNSNGNQSEEGARGLSDRIKDNGFVLNETDTRKKRKTSADNISPGDLFLPFHVNVCI